MADEASPAEIDRHLRAHALETAMRLHGVSSASHQMLTIGPSGPQIVEPTSVPHVPSMDTVLADAKKVYDFIRGPGTVTSLRPVGDVA